MKDIKYSLRGISVEQFATLFEPTGNGIELNLSIPVKTNYEERSFAVGANIQYLEDGKPFMVTETYCHYEIDEDCWNELSNGATKDVILPKELMDTLIRIAVSTTRGIICVKTENTPFSKYFLPIIEIGSSHEGEDFVFARTTTSE